MMVASKVAKSVVYLVHQWVDWKAVQKAEKWVAEKVDRKAA
jgi:hypothetical protein